MILQHFESGKRTNKNSETHTAIWYIASVHGYQIKAKFTVHT